MAQIVGYIFARIITLGTLEMRGLKYKSICPGQNAKITDHSHGHLHLLRQLLSRQSEYIGDLYMFIYQWVILPIGRKLVYNETQ